MMLLVHILPTAKRELYARNENDDNTNEMEMKTRTQTSARARAQFSFTLFAGAQVLANFGVACNSTETNHNKSTFDPVERATRTKFILIEF